MQKFKFKLDGLLKVREFKEKRLKVELGEILTQIQNVKDDIKRLNENIVETYEAQETFLADPTSGDMVKFFPRFIKTKKADIQNKENLLYALQKKFDQKQVELGTARGEVKVIENLKEKKSTEHKKKVEKKFQENIDELVQIRRLLKETKS
ncbi:flagellar export protein FliJ [Halobacteriovorax sp. JY17]|uniref:flagellar export protein FliJ n=1 Tax=Halobacteriovorax sp. JY17 TaxID=2014617 RepID=UPI000C5C2FE9|nr:flagellar export protein FliJ [Halobacteriovorax sp. JY17]PIK13853.1 MAG: flagellar export protein FliJ [Halobacteriovorax sp. JY17]